MLRQEGQKLEEQSNRSYCRSVGIGNSEENSQDETGIPAVNKGMAKEGEGLCRVLGQFRQMLAMPLGRSDYFHLLPVVGELAATVEACHVGSGQRSGLRTPCCTTNGYWEAVFRMLTTKNRFHKFRDHLVATFHKSEPFIGPGIVRETS